MPTEIQTDQLASTELTKSIFKSIDSIEDGVQWALDSLLDREPQVSERRSRKRVPYPQPFFITPLNAYGETITKETFSVIGHRLSSSGIDFYHQEAIPYRRVIASFSVQEDQWVAFVLNLNWCRFNRYGWYDNGGRFLRMVPSPLEQPAIEG
ncbi:MAG: hypothetical protein VXY07_15985 [Planctomycetota bacterium]|jgi:hypothetical protein|nr:hypothetical protein [Planctomycetota bacterium]MEC7449142.1 hypothetical protein [Planctomycetota bacterium]MEC7603457.1 hypothetical protein [Planctomycetota bacterium]MEC7716752.1 hypothetical protein [Planctomycetota bacterium]MEC7978474.1 hypothetical protein [Planctomycetota bacterium]